jgi:putative transcriptional regulator
MSKLGKRLIKAAKSAQAIARGEADPKTYEVHVPARLDVRAIRTKLKMSQNAFAARFGILPSTLRDWEQRRRHPDGAARVLLMVIDKEPDAVTRALAPTSRRKYAQKSAAPESV